jgi:hypothetical protein
MRSGRGGEGWERGKEMEAVRKEEGKGKSRGSGDGEGDERDRVGVGGSAPQIKKAGKGTRRRIGETGLR